MEWIYFIGFQTDFAVKAESDGQPEQENNEDQTVLDKIENQLICDDEMGKFWVRHTLHFARSKTSSSLLLYKLSIISILFEEYNFPIKTTIRRAPDPNIGVDDSLFWWPVESVAEVELASLEEGHMEVHKLVDEVATVAIRYLRANRTTNGLH